MNRVAHPGGPILLLSYANTAVRFFLAVDSVFPVSQTVFFFIICLGFFFFLTFLLGTTRRIESSLLIPVNAHAHVFFRDRNDRGKKVISSRVYRRRHRFGSHTRRFVNQPFSTHTRMYVTVGIYIYIDVQSVLEYLPIRLFMYRGNRFRRWPGTVSPSRVKIIFPFKFLRTRTCVDARHMRLSYRRCCVIIRYDSQIVRNKAE